MQGSLLRMSGRPPSLGHQPGRLSGGI